MKTSRLSADHGLGAAMVVALFVLGQLFIQSAALAQGLPSSGNKGTPTTEPETGPLDIQFVFPGSRLQGRTSSIVDPSPGRQLLTLHTASGTKIAALFASSPASRDSGRRPTIIYFYGNGMCMADSLQTFNRFRGLGFNVLMADYEGYGMSDGTPSEVGCYATADALYDYLLTRRDIDPKRIISAGWSLGAAVAIDLANRRPVAGLATFSAFTSIPDMNQVMSDRFPLALLVQSKFDNLTKMESVRCPIFMAHGAQDPLVPFVMMDKLKKAATANVTPVVIENAGHNDLFRTGGDALYDRFKTFMNQLPEDVPATHPS